MTAYSGPLVAALPMYDWPERRAEVEGEWSLLRELLLKAGLQAPLNLARCNGDLPAVPGGIVDANGAVIAPDPATLDPLGFDLHTLWRHPGLVFAQTCWGPMKTTGLQSHVGVVGQLDYSNWRGGLCDKYRSAIVMRLVDANHPASLVPNLIVPTWSNDSMGPPGWILECRGKRLAVNGLDSMSGYLALADDLVEAGAISDARNTDQFFGDLIMTGSHRSSIRAVAEGWADVAAIDCRSWALALRHEATARALTVVGWTRPRPGLPFICAPSYRKRVMDALHGFAGIV
jgi:ABC-type phosphate/phosphonate transport system substrate-binding protein